MAIARMMAPPTPTVTPIIIAFLFKEEIEGYYIPLIVIILTEV
jgi:hypothetical protein